jgi:ribonuclease HII
VDNTFDKLYYHRGDLIAGIDESGVSDIAGPLIAACVVLPKITADYPDLRIFAIDDSKKIAEKYRKEHAIVVWEVAHAIGIGEVQPAEIDYLGKRKAIILAMCRAVANCQTQSRKAIMPEFLLIDGDLELPLNIAQQSIRDGDSKSLSIAAASIISKVYRDEAMYEFHTRFPYYGWNRNKGYPCENQFRGMDEHGIQIGIHRTKFWPFFPNKERADNEKFWYVRRGVWREKTVKQHLEEIGLEKLITPDYFSKELQRSNNQEHPRKSGKNGNGSKERRLKPSKETQEQLSCIGKPSEKPSLKRCASQKKQPSPSKCPTDESESSEV